MARDSLTLTPEPDHEQRFCERCGIRVRLDRAECPRCDGPLVRRNVLEMQALERRAAQDRKLRRELRTPALVGAAGIGLTVVGIALGVLRSASVPLVEDRVVIGRPVARAAAAPPTRQPRSSEFVPDQIDDAVEGNRALSLGDLEGALGRYGTVLADRPDDLTALNNAGQALVRLGRAAEALPYFERAVALAPGSWMAQFNLAHGLGAVGDWSRAAEHYRAAAVSLPDHYPTLFNLANALQRAGRDEAASQAYAAAAASDVAEPAPWLQLGVLNERLGRREEARAAYERYLQMVPGAPERARIKERLSALPSAPASSTVRP